MYEVVGRLYKSGKINNKYLDVAIGLGWITQEQKQQIVNAQ